MNHLSELQIDAINSRLKNFSSSERVSIQDPSSSAEVVPLVARGTRTLRSRRLSEASSEQPPWLWKPYLNLNSVTLLDGREGIGKSTFMADLAARFSRGLPMPDGSPSGYSEPVNVLLVNREDSAATTRARVDAASGDLDRVITVDDFDWTIPDNMKPLVNLIRAINARVLFLDPFFSMLSPGVNTLQYTDGQRTMIQLSDELRQLECSALCVRHITKSGKGDAASRGHGAVSFAGSVRSILFMGRNPKTLDGSELVLSQSKTNLGPTAPSLAFKFVEDATFKVARIEWLGVSPLSANDLLSNDVGIDDRTMRRRVADLLPDLLVDGPMECREVERLCGVCLGGLSAKTVQRAASDIGCEVVNSPDFPPVRLYALPKSPRSGLDKIFNVHSTVQTIKPDNHRGFGEPLISPDKDLTLSGLAEGDFSVEAPR
jgi:hypothetical protein